MNRSMGISLGSAVLLLSLAVASTAASLISSNNQFFEAVKNERVDEILASKEFVHSLLDKVICEKVYYVDIFNCESNLVDFALSNRLDFIVKKCATTGMDLDIRQRSPGCLTPLEVAFKRRENDFSSFQALLYGGANPNIWLTWEKMPLLHDAVRSFDHKTVQSLLQAGATPSKRDSKGNTALHHAVRACDDKLVYLLSKKDSLQAFIRNGEGQTPLDVDPLWQHDEDCVKRSKGMIKDALQSATQKGWAQTMKHTARDKTKELVKALATPRWHRR